MSNCRVVVTGMGKSGIIAQKIAATLSSTGSPALFLHPAEAVHGDLGVLMPGDVVVALSASGETEEILRLLATLKRKGDALVSFCCNLTRPWRRPATWRSTAAWSARPAG
jgi:arabinose-5-phosphate isomerase